MVNVIVLKPQTPVFCLKICIVQYNNRSYLKHHFSVFKLIWHCGSRGGSFSVICNFITLGLFVVPQMGMS